MAISLGYHILITAAVAVPVIVPVITAIVPVTIPSVVVPITATITIITSTPIVVAIILNPTSHLSSSILALSLIKHDFKFHLVSFTKHVPILQPRDMAEDILAAFVWPDETKASVVPFTSNACFSLPTRVA